jgi:hypothetical protein
MSKKIKVFAIVVLILAVIIGLAAYFGRRSSPTASSGSPLSSSASKVAGVPLDTTTAAPSEFTGVLASIKSIVLDTSIFDDPAYRALRDYPITLGSDYRGRPNPFAPVGYDVGSISGIVATTEVQFETLQPAKITATTAEFGAQGILSTTDEAQVVFEYGTNDLLGSATAPIPLGKNGTALLRITGLAKATTYYVRAVLTQGSIQKTGNIMTFTTSAK